MFFAFVKLLLILSPKIDIQSLTLWPYFYHSGKVNRKNYCQKIIPKIVTNA